MSDGHIPYGRQLVDDEDVAAVVDVLWSDWLTTGPAVSAFETAFGDYVGARHAVAVCNGTAALHLAMLAAGIGAGDEVIVAALTFAASANCVLYAGATVVFGDIDPRTMTLDPAHVESLITARTKAIVAVDYAGLPCDLDALLTICARHNLLLVEDASHAPGAEYRGRRVGSVAHLTTFSLHPVKHMTSGEGGVVTTNDAALAERLRILRNHGITSDHRQREQSGTWRYDMVALGFNYRIPDILCALASSQLRKAAGWLHRRRQIAATYADQLADRAELLLPAEVEGRRHAWHLYPVRMQGEAPESLREQVFHYLRQRNIGVNVHYLPVYLHSYYQSLGYKAGLCPQSERAYASLLSLPMSHGLTHNDQARVVDTLRAALANG